MGRVTKSQRAQLPHHAPPTSLIDAVSDRICALRAPETLALCFVTISPRASRYCPTPLSQYASTTAAAAAAAFHHKDRPQLVWWIAHLRHELITVSAETYRRTPNRHLPPRPAPQPQLPPHAVSGHHRRNDSTSRQTRGCCRWCAVVGSHGFHGCCGEDETICNPSGQSRGQVRISAVHAVHAEKTDRKREEKDHRISRSWSRSIPRCSAAASSASSSA